MSGYPDVYAKHLLDYVTGVTETPDTPMYLCLLTSDPGPGATILDIAALEPKGANGTTNVLGYARQPIAFSPSTVLTDANGVRLDDPQSSSSAVVTFGPFSEAMTQPANYVALVTSANATADASADPVKALRRVEASDSGFEAQIGDTLTLPVGGYLLGFGQVF